MQGQNQRLFQEKELNELKRNAVASLAVVACFLYFLTSCASRAAYQMGSLDKPWVKRGYQLIHPDRTVIRFEKPRYYKGRLTGERKDHFYEAVTPEKFLASWGVDGVNPVVIKFSKKWEPQYSSGRLQKFIMEMDYYSFSSALGYQAGGKMTMKRIVIYRYMGANITNRMGIGIIGYSDRVLSHLQEFNGLVGSMSF